MKKLVWVTVCLSALFLLFVPPLAPFLSPQPSPPAGMDECLEEFVAGCATDGDCIARAEKYCSQFLEEGCAFENLGVWCDENMEVEA